MNVRVLLLASLAVAGPAFAQTSPDKSLVLSHVWARATPPNARTAAIYLTITDHGGPDRLLGAATPVAGAAGLHESKTVNGVMEMRPVAALPIEPGTPVTLAPGGLHLMLTGLKGPLKAGQNFPVTLSFEKGGAVTASVTVEKIGAAAPAAMPGMEMPGKDMK